MPTVELEEGDFADGSIGILDLLVKAGVAASKGEGRRLVTQGGISVNDAKISDIAFAVSKEEIVKGEVILKKGKKVFYKIVLKA